MQKKTKHSSVTPSPVTMADSEYSARRDYSSVTSTMEDRLGNHDIRNRIDTLSDNQRSYFGSLALGGNATLLSHRAGGARPRRNQQFGTRLWVDGATLSTPEGAVNGNSVHAPTTGLAEDDDDDDSDGILNYVAFGSKKSAK
jgi:hypothetical protein